MVHLKKSNFKNVIFEISTFQLLNKNILFIQKYLIHQIITQWTCVFLIVLRTVKLIKYSDVYGAPLYKDLKWVKWVI